MASFARKFVGLYGQLVSEVVWGLWQAHKGRQARSRIPHPDRRSRRM